MPHWHQGYLSDIEYTGGFMREMTPAWLHFVALLLGHRAPDPVGPLRLADLGCGHAVTAAVIAATHPGAEVWGFDLNPAHVESGRRLAAAAGLANLRVEEAAFADLAAAPPGAWPAFDIVTLHGVWTWIGAAARRDVVTFIGRFLRPGGLVYVSYNTLAGWAALLPVQRLMHRLAKADPAGADEAVRAALRVVDQLREGHAAYFVQNPVAGARLDPAAAADVRYLAHEYLTRDWRPATVGEVAAALGRAKCTLIGSATLTDNVRETAVPAALVPVIGAIRDPLAREMACDLASARAFRRDIYRRGAGRLAPAEAAALLDATVIAGLGTPPGEALTFDSVLGPVAGAPAVYDPLLERLMEGPLTIAEARTLLPFRTTPPPELLQALALLVAGGHAHPLLAVPPDGAAARRFNAAAVRLNALGGDIPCLAAPFAGTALTADVMETLIAGELMTGVGDVAALTGRVLDRLRLSGRSVQHAGRAVTDEETARCLVGASVTAMLGRRGEAFRRLGIL